MFFISKVTNAISRLHILLPTYSYFPYNYGGTEVYVSGLADFLASQGHEVTIIAGMPPEAFEDHKLFFENENLRTVTYFHKGIRVVGVILKDTNVTDIYSKYRAEWVISWLHVLQHLNIAAWDILHTHANTAAIGISLIKAAKLHSPKMKTVASYHVPISCVKGTLLFGNKMEMCSVRPAVDICTACFISDKKNWPLSVTKGISKIMFRFKNEKLSTNLRLKFLVNEFIGSFNSFNWEINKWHVFSRQIENILLLNSVEKNKILLLRHGVNPAFNIGNNHSIIDRQNKKKVIFLYAGRFDKAKGFFTMLKAWCTLPVSAERTLWIIGEIQGRDATHEKFAHKASERNDIQWLGIADQQTLAGKMKQVHCTIVPSECLEIGPLIFHEAIAAGSDVIASDIGGCEELGKKYADKTTLFKAGEPGDLAQKILQFRFSGKEISVDSQLVNYEQVLSSYDELKEVERLQSGLK